MPEAIDSTARRGRVLGSAATAAACAAAVLAALWQYRIFLQDPRARWQELVADRSGHYEFALDLALALRAADLSGYFATLCVIAGSFLRPVGGYLADRFGGIRMLTTLYLGVGLMMLGLSALPPLAWGTVFLFAGMGFLGMGNGSVFQLVPQRFSREIGVVTGLVGAAGGVGGFFLPNLLGVLKQLTGSFAGGFLIFALIGFGCVAALVYVSRAWEGVFVGQGGLATSKIV